MINKVEVSQKKTMSGSKSYVPQAGFISIIIIYNDNDQIQDWEGHIKNIHLHSCKHKTVTLKLTLTLTLTLTDTGGAVLTLMLEYRRPMMYKLKRKIRN